MIRLRNTKWSTYPHYDSRITDVSTSSLRTSALGKMALDAANSVNQILHKDISIPKIALSSWEKLPSIKKPLEKVSSATKSFKSKKKEDALKAIRKLEQVVKSSHQKVASSSTMFPFVLFPDDIILDRTVLTIIKRTLLSKNVISIRIEDILNVSINTGPFFGSINISSRVMNSTDHFTISFLPKREAIHLKKAIQGSMIACHNKIDTSELSQEELIKTLCELGDEVAY